MVFVDGVGLASSGPDNPLGTARLPTLTGMTGVGALTSNAPAIPTGEGQPLEATGSGRLQVSDPPLEGSDGPRPSVPPADRSRLALAGLDANLGVAGLPQSATGQTTLLTGVNAPAHIGRHLGPFPNGQLRDLLASRSVWRSVVDAGLTAAFANAFPDRYLDRAARGTGRMGAMARSAHLAGVRLRGAADLRGAKAVSPFMTNLGWRTHLGVADMPIRTVEEAGELLAGLATAHSLTVYETYATDRAGHDQDWDTAVKWLEDVDALCGAVLRQLPPEWAFVLVSDHGNVEDLSTPRHTRNPALLVTDLPPAGGGLGDWSGMDLTAVAPAIRRYLGLPDPEAGAATSLDAR